VVNFLVGPSRPSPSQEEWGLGVTVLSIKGSVLVTSGNKSARRTRQLLLALADLLSMPKSQENYTSHLKISNDSIQLHSSFQ